MSKILTFLHTSPVHIATFDHLLAESNLPIPIKHMVNESLLEEAQQHGSVTPDLARKIRHIIENELATTAAIVLCTCSTIGGEAEKVANTLRVDRPMAAKAVKLGSKIIIAAALATTFAPTRQIVLDEAQKAAKAVEISELLCGNAWQKFIAGDKTAYLTEIAHHLQTVDGQADVIILAQASMANATTLVNMVTPVLSSPRLGLETAIQTYLTEVGKPATPILPDR
jgi:hypothetical protein